MARKNDVKNRSSKKAPKKPKDDVIKVRGNVEEVLPGGKFRVILENECEVIAHLAGKLRKYSIRLGIGDEVEIELTPYDLTQGRITSRL